ncbi:MAG: NAD-dependent epimerase/dehydratase family protein, partial [Muribaculaceae bacterium]|nr:NAD-dependent epimerase/dehydratase family protein [Muribaculaceae bacterium]
LDTIGVRMFSVYGPWGRPDMAPLIFTDSITRGRLIELYSGGMQTRDFTYIDDVVESLCRLVMLPVTAGHHELYNIGSGNPVRVCELLSMIERKLGIKANYVNAPEQHIEARHTYADTSKLLVTTGYEPHTPLEDGIDAMLRWYKSYTPH